mmetsp:Transcript_721/g.1644  ORF Transcript_721/g.1644 Transcript_721/m.1644 type:complete len:262 (-) Transcript_721:742-1527(-)
MANQIVKHENLIIVEYFYKKIRTISSSLLAHSVGSHAIPCVLARDFEEIRNSACYSKSRLRRPCIAVHDGVNRPKTTRPFQKTRSVVFDYLGPPHSWNRYSNFVHARAVDGWHWQLRWDISRANHLSVVCCWPTTTDRTPISWAGVFQRRQSRRTSVRHRPDLPWDQEYFYRPVAHLLVYNFREYWCHPLSPRTERRCTGTGSTRKAIDFECLSNRYCSRFRSKEANSRVSWPSWAWLTSIWPSKNAGRDTAKIVADLSLV